ncbi:MAG: polysaccharide biosynthesis C-terminal domain-containing protein [Flavobacteriales bacterium]
MNTIAKQSLGFSIMSYLGTFLSIIASLFLYPENLEIHGILRSVLTAGEFFAQLFLFGSAIMMVKFFPLFKQKKGLLGIGFFITSTIFCVFLIFFLLNQKYILDWNIIKNKEFTEYAFYSLFLGLFLGYSQLLVKYISNYNSVAVPSIFERFLPRINIIVSFLLGGYFILMDKKQMLLFFIIGYGVIVLLLLLYLQKFEKSKIQIFPKSWDKTTLKSMLNFGFFTFLASFGSLLTFKIDTLMIPSILEFKDNSIYSICFSFGTIITIPFMAVYSISSPKITSFLTKNQLDLLESLYKKTSLFLFAFGLLFFGGIVLGIQDLFDLIPQGDSLKAGYNVVYLVSLGSWISISCGFNDQIIAYSKYYKFNIIAVLILAVLNISLNFYFLEIKKTGITGPAVASLIALVLFNIIKMGFIYTKYKILPFSIETIKIGVLGLIAFLIAYSIPQMETSLLNLLVKCSSFSFLFIGSVYIFKLMDFKFR